jgi:thiamine-phosphate pyrophosphorylase
MLPSPLCVICDQDVCERAGWTLPAFASSCLDGGARFLQVRAKRASAAAFVEATHAIVARARLESALVVVNDRADIARLAGAGGVHVGQEDLSPELVRTIVGSEVVVGFSTHTADQLAAALNQPVSYVAVGPVFGTSTKATGYEAIGLAEVTRAARQIGASPVRGLPLVAIGGITLGNARSVMEAGAQSVAVISDLLATNDPADRVSQFLGLLRNCGERLGRLDPEAQL